MNELVNRVESSILSRDLLRDGQSVLVAVSGGLDSMVLLTVLARLAPLHRWKLHVVHFNHRLRGRSSDTDERLVLKAARELNLPVSSAGGDVRTFAERQKISIEMAARELRHQFFAETAKSLKIRTVALAHHADDQLELLFLRLQRGSGGEGLGGMKWKSVSPVDPKIALVRPLLGERREVLEAFAHDERMRFREDKTNKSTDYLRNRIRQELIPILKQLEPPIFETALRSMEIAGAEAEFVRESAKAWRRSPDVPFDQLHVALQRRVIHDQLRDSGWPVDFDLIERLRRFPGEMISAAAGLVLYHDGQGAIKARKPGMKEFRSDSLTADLESAGNCAFGGLQLEWNIIAESGGTVPKRVGGTEWFDADAVGRRIVLRHWQPGDRFHPIGMAHQVKLQDWFVNQKVPLAERRTKVLAVAENGEIFWVEGMRISDRFKLKSESVRKLKWSWKSA